MAAMAETLEGGGARGGAEEGLLERVLSTTAKASGVQEIARVSQARLGNCSLSKSVQTNYVQLPSVCFGGTNASGLCFGARQPFPPIVFACQCPVLLVYRGFLREYVQYRESALGG